MDIVKSHRILPYIENNRFYNSPDDVPERLLFDTVPMFLRSLRARAQRFPSEQSKEWACHIIPIERSNEPRITWIGHATFLIQINGCNILTDPIFTHASFFFPRILPVGIMPHVLPPIDAILLSHNHPDHTDLASLRMIQGHLNIPLLVPQGDKRWLMKKGFTQVHEFMWWNHHELNVGDVGGAVITFLPAHHWSQRGFFDRNISLWGSWMIQAGGTTIYFAGDTAYSHHFTCIAQEFSSINVALMPIAPCDPEPWMRKTHMNAEQAVQACIDVQAHHCIPMHWGTFPFGTDTFSGPIDRLHKAWSAQQTLLASKHLHVLKVGQHIVL